MAVNTYAPGADPNVSDEDVWEGLYARYGGGWDDETDMRTRGGDDDDEWGASPRVERIPKRTAPDHVPGIAWDTTSCLCSCHFGARTSAGRPACDERECMAWGRQNAVKAARLAERKAQAWERRQARKAQGA